ncbi:MAG: xanthine dehydrogenase family protein subunit M [Solirubrobacteraceae bacterium MAG38_C4-C5]|nr:xanthine dehydrogenase family protein subunit M [Candidatus Siliceabacter maunaloa]
MIPTEFDYAAPESLDDALWLLGEGGEETRLLAGGHSLIPLMKLRVVVPTKLVDLRKVPGLDGMQREDGSWRIGAMTVHSELEHHPDLGLLSRAASTIADPQVRHCGTIGGSLAHGDPASDLPAVLLAAGGSVSAQGSGGPRTIEAADLFKDYMTTSVAPDEVITAVHVPALDGYGYGYQKFNRRAEDWAMVAVCALVYARDGVCEDVRVGLTHMASTPLRATAVEEALRGQPLYAGSIAEAAERAADATNPPGDLNATPAYKRHLARVLCQRALTEAAGLS